MQWLAALCVKRPVFATVLILSLTVIGIFSFTRLGVDRYPKVDFPTVLITTVQPGAAPEQIETEITDKIEEGVNTISGIDELRSVSSEGVSQVIISFLLSKDANVAAQEVRDKVNGVLPQLPRTIQQPRVDRLDPDAAPVLSIGVSANRPIRDITEYADKVLRRQLESVGGVGQVLVLGGRQSNQRLAERGSTPWPQPDGHRRHARCNRRTWRSRAGGSIRPQSLTLRRVAAFRASPSSTIWSSARRTATSRGCRVVETEKLTSTRPPTSTARPRCSQCPPAVGHEYRRSRQRREGAPRTEAESPARPRRRIVAINPSSSRRRSTTSKSIRRRLDSRGHRRAAVPGKLPVHHHCRRRHPDDHRHVRPDVHGLHPNMLTMLALTLRSASP
jgi:hypothetical protein